jgi:redox-sensitive bicupin YhaK (pirin superfamily)
MEGGVQRITMGKGIWHSEMPATKNLNHGIQLWVNLPQKLKQIDPSYEIYDSDKLPLKSEGDKIVKTIVGKYSPVKLKTDVEYYHVILNNSNYDWNVDSGKSSFVYIISGKANINVNSEVIQLEEGVLLIKKGNTSSSTNITTKNKINFIVLIGKPHQEPIRQHGSFVD